MARRFRYWVFSGLLLAAALVSPALAAGDLSGVQMAEGGAREGALFCVFGGLTLLSALGVALSKNVVRMAVWLFATLGSVAMLYFLLAANFLGAIQLIVYAGGTLVLLVFGVMLTSKSPWVRFDARPVEVWGAGLVCLLLLWAFVTILGQAEWPEERTTAAGFSVADLGRELLTTYLVPFEVTSVLLLVVMIGAAYLARQER